MKYILILSLIILPQPALTLVYGTAYSFPSLDPLQDVVITVNTSTEQTIVSPDGTYSLSLPNGTYLIKAFSYVDGELAYYGEEIIEVRGNGSYHLDLLLYPPFMAEDLGQDVQQNTSKDKNFVWLLVIGVVLVFILYKFLRKDSNLDKIKPDLKLILSILDEEGGRITQKDLRKRLGWSESKTSLALSELEKKGLIERYKVGRGNVIYLKDCLKHQTKGKD
jgi:uncharacterized membrane protein